MHDVHRRLRDDDEVVIGDDERDFENAIAIGLETRHFEVDPDEPIRVRRHARAR
jgi:hypothetical protein